MKKTMKLVALTLAMLMLVACAAACGGGSEDENKEAGKVLNICMGSDCETMNAHATPSSTPSTPYSYCSAFLWRAYPNDTSAGESVGYHYIGDLAKDMPVLVKTEENAEYELYEAVLDAAGEKTGEYTHSTQTSTLQTWEFEIREEACWQNGDKLTAEEIVYSWEKLADPALANAMGDFLCYNFQILNCDAYRWGQLPWSDVGIKVVDGNKIQVIVVGETSESTFCANFNDRSLCPVKKDIYEQGLSEGTSKWGTSLENWMSCGPYTFSSWTEDSVQTYVKNEDHWLADLFHYDQVNVHIVPEMNARVQMFESNQLDTLAPDANTIDQYLDDPRMTVYGSTSVYHIDVNCKNTDNPLCSGTLETQVAYRKALYHALERKTIAYELFGQQQETGTYVNLQAGLLSESGLTYRESSYGQAVTQMVADWSAEGYTTGYNPEKAVDYMKQAWTLAGLNWEDSTKITLKLVMNTGESAWKATGEFMQEEFPKIFVNTNGDVKVDIEIIAQGNMSSTNMKKPVDQGGFGDNGWDLSPNDWSRSASRINPYTCFYYYTDQYTNCPNNYFSEEFNNQYRVCQAAETSDYDTQLKECQKLEELYLEYVIHLPVAQVVNYELFAEDLVLPTDVYIPGYGWGLIYGDIAE